MPPRAIPHPPASAARLYLRGGAAGAAARVLDAASGLSAVWILTQVLPPAEYGLLAVGFAVLGLLVPAGTAGLEHAVLVRAARLPQPPGELAGREIAGAALGRGLVLGVLVALALYLASPALGRVFDKPGLGAWLALLAVLVPLRGAQAIYTAWHRARQRLPGALLFGGSLPQLAVVLALLAVWRLAPGREGVVAAYALAPLLVFGPWFARAPAAGVLAGGGALTRSDRAYGVRLMGTALLNRGIWSADLLLLGVLALSESAAQYSVAARLALLVKLGHDLLGAVFVPRIGSHLAAGRERALQIEYERNRRVALLAALLLACALALLGRPLLALFGDYAGAHPVLLLLLGAYLVPVAFGSNGAVLNMAGDGGFNLRCTGLALIANLALNAILIPPLGAAGAALATLISLALLNGLISARLHRRHRFAPASPAALWPCAAGAAALALGAAGVAGDGVVAALLAAAFLALLVRSLRGGPIEPRAGVAEPVHEAR